MIEVIPNFHPLFVHFPIALISVAAFFYLAARLLRNRPRYASHCAVLAHATLWLGALAALPTAFLGWLAFNSVDHDDAGHAAMLLHRAWASAALLVLLALAGWDAWKHKVDDIPAWPFVTAVFAAWILVATTAWHGGELVYRHGLGVMSLLKAQRPGHPDERMPAHAELAPHDEGDAVTGMPPQKAGHSHAPGTAPHKD